MCGGLAPRSPSVPGLSRNVAVFLREISPLRGGVMQVRIALDIRALTTNDGAYANDSIEDLSLEPLGFRDARVEPTR